MKFYNLINNFKNQEILIIKTKEITNNILNNYKKMYQIIKVIASTNNLQKNKQSSILSQTKNQKFPYKI